MLCLPALKNSQIRRTEVRLLLLHSRCGLHLQLCPLNSAILHPQQNLATYSWIGLTSACGCVCWKLLKWVPRRSLWFPLGQVYVRVWIQKGNPYKSYRVIFDVILRPIINDHKRLSHGLQITIFEFNYELFSLGPLCSYSTFLGVSRTWEDLKSLFNTLL